MAYETKEQQKKNWGTKHKEGGANCQCSCCSKRRADKTLDEQMKQKKEKPTFTHLTKKELHERWLLEMEFSKNGLATTKTLAQIQEERDALHVWGRQADAERIKRMSEKSEYD